MEILYTIIVLLVISIVFGTCIVLVETQKPKKKQFEKVRNLIAGLNCGGCGYPNCDQFCEALCKGESDVYKCRPTNKSNKEQIESILKEDKNK